MIDPCSAEHSAAVLAQIRSQFYSGTSGTKPSRRKLRTVEECVKLPARKLITVEKRAIAPSKGRIEWDGKRQSIGFQVLVDGGACLEMEYTAIMGDGRRVPITCRIELGLHTLRSGGVLPYFECAGIDANGCGRRADVIFKPPDSGRFACRKCHKLTYRDNALHNTREGRLRKLPPEQLVELIRLLPFGHPDILIIYKILGI